METFRDLWGKIKGLAWDLLSSIVWTIKMEIIIGSLDIWVPSSEEGSELDVYNRKAFAYGAYFRTVTLFHYIATI